jgi:hypothetical protein
MSKQARTVARQIAERIEHEVGFSRQGDTDKAEAIVASFLYTYAAEIWEAAAREVECSPLRSRSEIVASLRAHAKSAESPSVD